MTFAITTKSGRSVNIKAENYREAQKYADRHFGKGCIVQLVGNAARNAQPWLVPGDRVKSRSFGGFGGGDEGTVVDDLGHVNGHRMIRVKWGKTGRTEDMFWDFGSIVPIKGKCRFYKNSVYSTNPTVANALAAKSEVADALACNAGRKTVKVELETVSFEKGVRSETRYMSVEEVRDLLKRLGQSGDADSFISRLERQGASDIAINEPDLYAALI